MKIGIDISQIVYQGTGVSRYTTSLVSKLTEIDRSNEYVLFGTSLRQKKILKDFHRSISTRNNKVVKKIYPFPPTLIDILWNKLHIVPIEKFTGPIDIFHTSDWLEPPAKAAKVTTIHDFLALKYPSFFPKSIIETQRRRVFWVLQETKKIIVDSKSTKKDGINLLSIPEEKMVVIYPGISENFKPQTKEEIERVRKKYLLAKQYILSVGTVEPRKNLNRVIDSFMRLVEKFEIELIIVGRGGWGIRQEVSDPRIKFLGYVPEGDLAPLYSGSSCFIYASSSEGFGFPVLEALACGASVVTSAGGSLEEIGGKYVTYIKPQSVEAITLEIEKVLEKKEKKINSEKVSWARSFSWETTAKEVLKVYQEVFTKK